MLDSRVLQSPGVNALDPDEVEDCMLNPGKVSNRIRYCMLATFPALDSSSQQFTTV